MGNANDPKEVLNDLLKLSPERGFPSQTRRPRRHAGCSQVPSPRITACSQAPGAAQQGRGQSPQHPDPHQAAESPLGLWRPDYSSKHRSSSSRLPQALLLHVSGSHPRRGAARAGGNVLLQDLANFTCDQVRQQLASRSLLTQEQSEEQQDSPGGSLQTKEVKISPQAQGGRQTQVRQLQGGREAVGTDCFH